MCLALLKILECYILSLYIGTLHVPKDDIEGIAQIIYLSLSSRGGQRRRAGGVRAQPVLRAGVAARRRRCR